jgi:hypothetical protein
VRADREHCASVRYENVGDVMTEHRRIDELLMMLYNCVFRGK